jgi:predicted MFS family arabinose efflux permease
MSALRVHRPAHRLRCERDERRIVVLIGALLLFESSMYSALTPVLPHYQHLLHASKPAVGLLAASYPAGIIPGSILGGWVATRGGVRRTTLVGLLLFSVSIAAFGFGSDAVTLDALRFAQGIACGCIWGGGLTWVIVIAPRERRGQVLGSVFAAAIFGTLLGPVLGTLAVAAGTGPVFTLVGAIALGLAAWTARHPDPGRAETGGEARLGALLRHRRVQLGGWLILLEAATLGATGTLVPLRLARFGASGAAIGATFLLSALLSARLASSIGKLVDRRGAGLPITLGLALTAVLLALLPLPASPLPLAIVAIVAIGGPLTAYTLPAMSVITETAERAGLAIALGPMLLNLAWASGEMIGAPTAAGLSQATSDAVPLLGLAALMLLTLPLVARAKLHVQAAPGAGHPGDPGASGAPGEPAASGAPGEPAAAGAPGTPGAPGEPGPPDPPAGPDPPGEPPERSEAAGVHAAAAVATSTP